MVVLVDDATQVQILLFMMDMKVEKSVDDNQNKYFSLVTVITQLSATAGGDSASGIYW